MTCSLRSLRASVESLATSDGRFGVACARTGVTPVPLARLWFESRADAGMAARLASAYRARLRRFDPAFEYHDLVVHERPAAPATATADAAAGDADSGRDVDSPRDADPRRDAEPPRDADVEAKPPREDGD